MPPAKGDLSPKFKLKNSFGVTKTSEDFRGRYLVIYFYPKDNTPGCTKESCKFRDLNAEFLKMNCEIIGISADSQVSHKEFSAQYGLNFNLLSDPNYNVCKDFGTYFVSEKFGDSILRQTFLINADGLVLNVWKEIKDPENHPEDVLRFVQSDISV